ncbi:MAG TPA: sulfite exporter TauE/SafE family protein [Thermoanaerobaculia bacterium]|nr:sulfite exporter TauE/SafE family protein [Thermoanaerobaculia bacterium]
MTLPQALILIAASFGAGVMNAMAGGGTILTFPSLVFLGLPSIAANATSTVALLPASLTSLYGFRDDVRMYQGWLKRLFLPSLIGGAVGSVLLLRTPEKTFASLAPLLILFATVLFMAQGLLARRTAARKTDPPPAAPAAQEDPSPGRWVLAILLQLGVAVYGGYFGAGIGILMLALLGFLGLANIHAANGIKNFLGFCINVVAAAYFIFKGAVVWPAALVIVGGGAVGGYAGARFAKRIGKEKARAAVVVIGLVVTAILFWQRATK